MRRRLLLVEDDPTLRQALTFNLAREGYEVATAADGEAALEAARNERLDLVLLDVMLPDGSGFDVCRELRRTSRVPIIMLTARGDETDRIVGLEIGADDNVVKPVSAREVVARIRAVLRRTEGSEQADSADDPIEIGAVRLDPARRSVSMGGEPIELSRKEFDLLRLLMANAGSVLTRERIIEEVWDTTWFGQTKTLDVHVSSLRKKLGDDPADPTYVHTARGAGFRFAARDEVTGGTGA